jgi:uncharacterized protein
MEEIRSIYDATGWWIIITIIILMLAIVVLVVLRKKTAGAMIIGDRGSASPFWWFLGGRVPGDTEKGWEAFSGADNDMNEGPGGGSSGTW